MTGDPPKLKKGISDLAPTKNDISARIRSAGAKTLVAALGFLGINIGSSPSYSMAAEMAMTPVITNRKEKNGPGGLVLQLASNLTGQNSFFGHTSHSSHSSHSSHYSGSGGSSGTTQTATPKTTAQADSLLATAETLTGRITEIQSEKGYFTVKDASDNIHTIYFEGTTQVRLLSPSDQTSTIDALKAFTNSIPLKIGNNVMVQWKTIETKKKALKITLFELSK